LIVDHWHAEEVFDLEKKSAEVVRLVRGLKKELDEVEASDLVHVPV
jgi:hypothetical protein